MYFDYSYRKFLFVATLAFLLVVSVSYSFMTIVTNAEFFRQAANALTRARADLGYWVVFKMPTDALAAVGLASAPFGASSAASGTAQSIPVLVYHGEGVSTTTLSTAVFVEQMHALHAAGWRTVTLDQFTSFMKDGAALPEKSFLLTFDDGRHEAFYDTDPLLKDLGYTAVMFVITGLSLPNNGPNSVNNFYLSKSELAYMSDSGRWELESHGDQDHRGYTIPVSTESTSLLRSDQHFLSNKLWLPEASRVETTEEYRARIAHDLAFSQELLEGNFGKDVTAFAYPYNDFGQESVNFPESIDLLRDIIPAHYTFAFYQTWPGNGDSFNHPDRDAYFLKRIEALSYWSGAELVARLEGGRAKPLPYRPKNFGTDWSTNWGTIRTGPVLTLTATDSTSGAAAFLDGTGSWGNYSMNATVHVKNGTVSLIARYKEKDIPYAVCAFSSDHIYLERHVGKTQETIAQKRYAPPLEPATWQVSMEVNNGVARCSAYGVVVEAGIAGMSDKGGTGVSTWDPQLGEAHIELGQLTVRSL